MEATRELGEIGAGIQMFGNVSRFLIRCGIDEIAGKDLVSVDELRLWQGDSNGQLLGLIDTKRVERMQGFPWWVLRRDHLHSALVECARRHGVKLVVDFRIAELDHSRSRPRVVSANGIACDFDLIIGADGIKSFMRTALFPDLLPKATSNIAAYRDVISYEELYSRVPEARTKIGNTMDAWVGPGGYILLYPISGGRELNIVAAFEQPQPVTQIEDIDIETFRDHYKHWDSFLIKTWSNPRKNVVLMGDAIHGMQNHMAQGAACAMEDGIFLGRVLNDVVRGNLSLSEAIGLYERKRIPRAWLRQQASFIQGELCAERGEVKIQREAATSPEITRFNASTINLEELPPTYRSWLLFASPNSIPGILYYDAEGDADFAVCEYLQSKGDTDPRTFISEGLRDRYRNTVWNNRVGMTTGLPKAGTFNPQQPIYNMPHDQGSTLP